MKEFVLTQSYGTVDEMLNSGEVDIYRAELAEGNIDFYAIVSRIGNRYDIFGNRITSWAENPYLLQNCVCAVEDCAQAQPEIKEEVEEMKYAEIETLIDNEVAKAVEGVKAEYEHKIEELKALHATELETAKETAKAELIAKLTA